ncbi:uncharacterized protein [Watersipora subatra]|uniref:uncharacterized protein n=1 Tax=Watersipora subatra TaxID=2589382 RepID=UPI00355C077F
MNSAGDLPGGGGAESDGASRGRGGSASRGVKVTKDSEGNVVFSKQKMSELGKNENEAGIKHRVEESNNRGPDSKLKKPCSSLPLVAKMDSFVEEMESQSRRTRELEEEIRSEEYKEALLHLAAVKQKRVKRRGARKASSVTTTRKESKVEESKEEFQPETSVVRVVPSGDASCEESKVEEPKEVQPESSGKCGNDDQLAGFEPNVRSGNDDQLAGSEPKVQSGNDDQLVGFQPKVQSGNDDQLAGSEPKVTEDPVAMEEEPGKADWYGDTVSIEEGDLLNEDEAGYQMIKGEPADHRAGTKWTKLLLGQQKLAIQKRDIDKKTIQRADEPIESRGQESLAIAVSVFTH